MPARFTQVGDPHDGIDDAVFCIDTLLEWTGRDPCRCRRPERTEPS
jgi:hypothetical protein